MKGSAHVLAVPDAGATARWWVEVVGFAIEAEPEGWVFVRSGKVTLMLGSCPDAIHPRDLGDHQYFAYLEVADVDEYHAQAAARGADILFAPADRPWACANSACGPLTATASWSERRWRRARFGDGDRGSGRGR